MLNTFWITTRWALIPTIISMIVTTYFIPDFYWNSELFHVLIEVGGALIGFGLAIVILAMIQKEQLGSNHLWLIACFISMGTLDLFHSQQYSGQIFVWLHTAATLVGGLFAMLIWLSPGFSRYFFKPRYLWLILLLSIGYGSAVISQPGITPVMLDTNMQFTLAARLINILGGIGFFIAWLYFAREYHRLHQPQSFYFSNHFCLFAIAGFVFEFSALWDGNWWFWHMARAFAYLFLMLHFGIIYRAGLLHSLEDSETRYRSLIHSSPDWIWEVDANAVYTFASPRVYELLGYRPEEIIGKTPFDLMPQQEAERIGAIFSGIAAEKRAFNNLRNTNIHKNGHTVVLETSGVPIINHNGELLGYRGSDRDITQRNQNETELRLQRDFNNTILQAAGNVIVVLDLNGCFVRFNRASEILTGYRCEEVLGRPVWDLVIPEEQMEGVKNVFYKLKKGEINIAGEYENEWLTRDGSRRLLHWHNTILRDTNGNISHIMTLGYDITEQRKSEKEQLRLQKELQQAQKMESLGQLTGGIAHDFNNLLGIISGYTNLAIDKFQHKSDSKLINYLENIKNAGERATSLISQMLVFSSSNPVNDTAVKLAPIIQQDIKMLRASLPSTISIEQDIDTDLPEVLINPTKLHQILVNLAINARDAMNGAGKLTIALKWSAVLDTVSPISHKPVKGRWIELSVTDTGTGIQEQIIKNIFNPFFTTKEVGRGSGLGLSMIYRIMEDQNGHILLDSELGKGSTFRLLFTPAPEHTNNKTGMNNQTSDLPRGNGSEILIVDDEPLLAEHLSEFLKAHGYRTFATSDSTEALKLFTEQPDRFSLLITDQTMPNLTGMDLISKIRNLRPGFPLILCSGYSDKIDPKETLKNNIPYFEKPVNSRQLLLTITELINSQQ